MKRRIFLYTLGGALLTRPRVALAQQIATPKRIAILSLNRRDADPLVAVVDGLKSLGFEEGKNLTVDERGIGRRPEELMSVAAQLAQSKLDAIVAASGGLAVAAAQAATRTIPIIGIADDMVLAGYVRSWREHNGDQHPRCRLDSKRLEILTDLLPKARHIAVLADSTITSRARVDELKAAALTRQVELSIHPAGKSDEIPAALEAAQELVPKRSISLRVRCLTPTGKKFSRKRKASDCPPYSSGPKASGTARSWHTAQARWKRFGRWAESPARYWQAPPLRIFRSSNRLHSGSRLTWGSHAHSAFRCPQRCSLAPTR